MTTWLLVLCSLMLMVLGVGDYFSTGSISHIPSPDNVFSTWWHIAYLPVAFIGAAVVLWRLPDFAASISVLGVGFGAIGLNFVFTIPTQTYTSATTILFIVPVLVCAYHWSISVAAVYSVLAVTAAWILLLIIGPLQLALTHLLSLTVVIAAITVALGMSSHAVRKKQDVLRTRAATDSLTGLATRQRAEAEMNTMHNGSAQSLILLDLDDFKAINDTFGHDIGDVVLQQVAVVIKRHAPKGATPYRLGGDEFGIYCPHHSDDDAFRVADRIVADCAAASIPVGKGQICTFTVSAGVASGAASESLYQAADASMYEAKVSGKAAVGSPTGLTSPASVPADHEASPRSSDEVSP